jgi:hypothetical protein
MFTKKLREIHFRERSVLTFPSLSRNLKIKIYRNIALPVVLYGCETQSLTPGEEHRLRASDNRKLKRIFGPKREEVTGVWRRLHNEELHNLYASPIINKGIKWRRMRWVRYVARTGGMKNAYKNLLRKTSREEPFGRPESR